MRQGTLKKYIKILKDIKDSNLSIKTYCAKHKMSESSIYGYICVAKKQNDQESELVRELISLYDSITNKDTAASTADVDITLKVDSGYEVEVETDDKAETSYTLDENNKIKYYNYKIYRRNKPAIHGNFTREEMDMIYRLYSYYGDSLTQRVISRHFPDLSLIDFKRILRAFNITKASSPFAPHMIEEKTEEELREIQLREKENSFLRKAEEDDIKNTQKLLKKFAQENIDLKRQLERISNFNITLPDDIKPVELTEYEPVNQSINLYLSDIHLGGCVTTGSLYKENSNYGFKEAKRRLNVVLNNLRNFDCFDTINLVLMGDNIDCSGFFGKTARLDHDMPENMDPREQANKYIELIMWFIASLVSNENELCSKIRVFSVPCGNHGGSYEYMCNKALLAYINAKYPSIETTMWEEFYGVFEQNNNTLICCHGKDDQYMKKGLPLNLDDKSKVLIYEWLEENNIHGNNIHFVKGDLHSNSLNSCRRFDYRNVLSLFGASDYSNYNFSRNSYGLSYDLFVGDNIIRGTFENM
jgi:hypothetical protein